jgi:integrase
MPSWRLTRLNGEYCITWDDDGGVRRRYRLGTSDPKEAARRAPARYAELTRPVGRTVADLWRGYEKDMAGRAVVGTMAYTWRALKDRFGPMDGEAITIEDCREHTRERHKAGIKDGTIHTELGHLRMVLKWAEKHRFIGRAPAIERPTKPEPKHSFLTRAEVTRMLDAANAAHIRLAILLMIGTGARSTAARELTWDRVDFERRIIQLRNPFDTARRKGRATIPMNDMLVAALSEAKEGALSPFVLEWAGKPIGSIKRGLKAAGTAIGRPDVSPHMLRHSAAVWLAEDGHSMEEIAQFLGHSNTKMTVAVYARFSPTHLRKLADSLDLHSALRFAEPGNRNAG